MAHRVERGALRPRRRLHAALRGGEHHPARQHQLQLVARAEYDRVEYRAGPTIGVNQLGPSQAAGTYAYWSVGVAANLWWTRHVRLTLDYIANHIDGATANVPAPGQTYLHEFGARVGLSL